MYIVLYADLDNQIEEDRICRLCSMHGTGEKCSEKSDQ